MRLSKKLTFQLTPLLDLLLIVLFAQYLEVQQTSEEALESVQVDQSKLEELDELKREYQRLSDQRSDDQFDAAQTAEELREQVRAMREDRDRIKEQFEAAVRQAEQLGRTTSEMFQIPEQLLSEVLESETGTAEDRTPEERERIRKEFARLAQSQAAATIKHIVAHAELRKRCDIWEVTLKPNEQVVFKPDVRDDRDAESNFRFWNGSRLDSAETVADVRRVMNDAAETFADRLFANYKQQGDLKTLVIILFVYPPDAGRELEAALDGLRRAVERMRDDSRGRSRFEYAVLGFPTNE